MFRGNANNVRGVEDKQKETKNSKLQFKHFKEYGMVNTVKSRTKVQKKSKRRAMM